MPFLLGFPEWLFGERYLTFATWGLVLCTFFLVIATLVAWLDSWKRGKEQRDRWTREDERYDSELRPKYRFGLRLKVGDKQNQISSKVVLWIANLGTTGLYTDRLFIRHRDFEKAEIAINRLVSSREDIEIDLPNEFWETVPGIRGSESNYLYGDHEIWLTMADSDSEFETPRILYDFMYHSRFFSHLRRGSHEMRQPQCPKCGFTLNFVLPASGLLTEKEVQENLWRKVLDDLNRSCPNHFSEFLEPIGGSQ